MVIWVLSQCIPRKHSVHVLAIGGALAGFSYAPIAMAWISLTVVEAALMVLCFTRLDRKSSLRKYGAYLLLFNLLFVDFHSYFLNMPLAILGISFSVIRVFITARQLISSRKTINKLDVYWIWVAAFYLPALVIGPVFSGTELRDQYKDGATYIPTLRDYRMVVQGIVFSVFATALFGAIASKFANISVLLAAPVFFLNLFLAFWGQSLIAEHTSRFFGYVLPVNFDRPWKARNMHEFWNRWHRSMAQFVLQYIFLPLNLRGLSPKLATIAAFVFMGLWHNLSIGYFVWGLCHGGMLAFSTKTVSADRSRQMLARVGLWTIVIGLSYFAIYGPYS
jgi:D-alanyl-lipoteichoic acid acyltransferase DltB (MBOAT superfamily)